MKSDTNHSARRNFIKLTTTACCAFPLMGFEKIIHNSVNNSLSSLDVHLFSKHLQFLDYKDMSEIAAELGFDGLDLTVRPKGHVLPERVSYDLPRAVEAMQNFNLQPRMMTTSITDITHSESLNVLENASNLGITHYRTGWLKYNESKDNPEQVVEDSRKFRRLADMNQKLGLLGGYQNHVGDTPGLPIWYIHELLKMTHSKYMGSQYDIRHAMAGDENGWEHGLKLIHPFINSIAVKDFKWGMKNGRKRTINTPLGKGIVNFQYFFSLLKKYQINVPVSLHLEYDLGGAENGAPKITIDRKVVFKHMKGDLAFLRKTWQQA